MKESDLHPLRERLGLSPQEGHDPGFPTSRIPHFVRVSYLTGCFDRYEKEYAAALLMIVCRERRSWTLPIGPNEILQIASTTKDGFLMATSPFRPDFYGLKAMGAISITGLGAISLREKFFERAKPMFKIWEEVRFHHRAFYRWQDDGGAIYDES